MNCVIRYDRYIVINFICCVWLVFFVVVLWDEMKCLREVLCYIIKISCEGDLIYLVEKMKVVLKILIVLIRIILGF